jgi:hypothetical protein
LYGKNFFILNVQVGHAVPVAEIRQLERGDQIAGGDHDERGRQLQIKVQFYVLSRSPFSIEHGTKYINLKYLTKNPQI